MSELHVISTGAIEPGLLDAVEVYREETGQGIRITWATTPVIRKRIGGGEKADVVIATREAMDDFARDDKVIGEEVVPVGHVGVGVAVRDGAPVPDVSTVGAVRYAVLDAESVVYNRASSGLYVERMLDEMKVLDRIQAKIARYNNGPAMMEHLVKGRGKEIGFGAITEILMFRDKGLELVGPLPPDLQHYTEYAAAPMSAAPDPEGAEAFVRFLDTPAARGLFAGHGIE